MHNNLNYMHKMPNPDLNVPSNRLLPEHNLLNLRNPMPGNLLPEHQYPAMLALHSALLYVYQ